MAVTVIMKLIASIFKVAISNFRANSSLPPLKYLIENADSSKHNAIMNKHMQLLNVQQ